MQPGPPMALPDLPHTIVDTTVEPTVMRIGVVTGYLDGSLTVAISGSDVLVDASYMRGITLPAMGEKVVVLRQASQWVVLGALSPRPAENPVLNASFEDDPVGAGLPSSWFTWDDGAATTRSTFLLPHPMREDGQKALGVRFAGPGIAANYMSSVPIACEPGEFWAASAQACYFADPLVTTTAVGYTSAQVYLAFYPNDTDVYPTFPLAISALDDSVPASPAPIWFQPVTAYDGASGCEVPVGATHLRVTLRSVINCVATHAGFMLWDRVVARRLS